MDGFNCGPAITLLMGVMLIGSLSCSKTTPESFPITSHSPDTTQSTENFPVKREDALETRQLRTGALTDQANVDPSRIEPGQVCVINANMADAKKLDQFANVRGYAKKKRRVLESLGFVMSILQVPPGQRVNQGIRELREAFPSQVVDANHYYDLQGLENKIDPRRYAQQLVGWTEQAVSCKGENVRIGMVDTSVSKTSPFLQEQAIHTQSFLSGDTPEAASNHGTAVATLLVGQSASVKSGLLPKATLFAAESFRKGKAERVEATTWSIVRALDWLVEQHVQVINLSVGGPHNDLLEYAIEQTLSHKIPIVAAAGNTGPRGQMMYPAALDGVLAVTALDAKLHPYMHANRGSHIAFSAPGVDIWVPKGNGNGVFKSGTSFAAPFVTTAAATVRHVNPQWTPEQVAHYLANEALDLGANGKDDIFGWGLIQMPSSCEQSSSLSPT